MGDSRERLNVNSNSSLELGAPFPRSANTVTRLLLLACAALALLGLYVWYGYARSSFATGSGEPVLQPVLFSHRHHAGELGIDCRYCHTSVEEGAFAGMPATETCMTCHSQIYTDSPMLAPIRESFRTGLPMHWNRVYDLPDFVYFDHSIHVASGISCNDCHGEVENMALIQKAQPLFMTWCVDCHRQHEPTRPLPSAPEQAVVEQLGHPLINPLTNCSVCHR